jgi:hypothetical protein
MMTSGQIAIQLAFRLNQEYILGNGFITINFRIVGIPKSKASKGPVPLHPRLAEFMLLWKQKTPYSQAGDWVFSSFRLEGKQPRVADMLVEDHLRPASVKAGILSSHRTWSPMRALIRISGPLGLSNEETSSGAT